MRGNTLPAHNAVTVGSPEALELSTVIVLTKWTGIASIFRTLQNNSSSPELLMYGNK